MVTAYAASIASFHNPNSARPAAADDTLSPQRKVADGHRLGEFDITCESLDRFSIRKLEEIDQGPNFKRVAQSWEIYESDFSAYAAFKKALLYELDDGSHFVPLLGHGLSQRAGVITAQHNFPYLIYTIWCCVGGARSSADWSLEKYGFPPFPDDSKLTESLEWLKTINRAVRQSSVQINDKFINELSKLAGCAASRDSLPEAQEFSKWNDLGDWVRALHLLCCLYDLKSDSDGYQNLKLRKALDIKPDLRPGDWHRRAMDGFNIFSSRGVRPGLAHQMLAYLARPLSIHTSFTTSPDDLIEQAFRKVRLNLRSFDVRGNGDLPGLDQVRAQDSVIRLNYLFTDDPNVSEGGENEEHNKRRFFEYLYPGFSTDVGEERDAGDPEGINIFTPPGRLLVIGFQPKYPRVLSFIGFVLDRAMRVRNNNQQIGDALKVVEGIRSQLGAYGGNVFRVERRCVHEFIDSVGSDIENLSTLSDAEPSFNSFKEMFEKCRPQVVNLENLHWIASGELVKPELEEHFVALHGAIQNGFGKLKNPERWETHYKQRLFKGLDNKGFFKSYVWPTFLAESYITTMNFLRDEGLSCEWAIANFKIFWIASSRMEVEQLRELLKPRLESSVDEVLESDIFHFAHTSRPDILLYEIYQEVTLCLPPGGLTYQFAHMLPPDPPPLLSGGKNGLRLPEFDVLFDQLNQALGAKSKPDGYIWAHTTSFLLTELPPRKTAKQNGGRLLVAYGGRGLSSVFSLAMREKREELIWFEIADHATPTIAYHDVLTMIAHRTGRLQREHLSFAYPTPDGSDPDPERVKLLRNRLWISSRSWVVVFYARNLPGTNGRWDECSSWKQKDYCTFYNVLLQLADLGLTIVYLPLRASRAKELAWRLAADYSRKSPPDAACGKSLPAREDQFQNDCVIYREVTRLPGLTANSTADDQDPGEPAGEDFPNRWLPIQELSSRRIFRDLRQWIEEGRGLGAFGVEFGDTRRDRLRFLHVLTLFRHSRHLSVMCSEGPSPNIRCFERALGDDKDLARAVNVREWVEKLYDIGLMRRKSGGFAWIHWSLRFYLQRCLEEGLFPNGDPLSDMLTIPLDQREKLGIDLPASWLWQQAEAQKQEQYLNIEHTAQALRGGDIEDHDQDANSERGISGWRARSHHWIADWYFKAFLASRHPLPLQECLHHHLQAIRNAPKAELPTQVKQMRGDEEHSLTAYRVQLVRISLLGIARMLKLALPTIQFWMDEEVGRFFQSGSSKEAESGTALRPTESLPQLVDMMNPDVPTDGKNKSDLKALWPLLPENEQETLSRYLNDLLLKSDAQPICELIRRQSTVIFRILQDEKGERLFYGREPDDEVSHRLQWRSFSGTESLYFNSASRSANIYRDLARICSALIVEMRMTFQQAVSITGRLHDDQSRNIILEKISRSGNKDDGFGKFDKQAIIKALREQGWREPEEEAEALLLDGKLPRFNLAEACHIFLGDWLARTSWASEKKIEQLKNAKAIEINEMIAPPPRNSITKEDVPWSIEGLTVFDLKKFNETFADFLILAHGFQFRRRDEIREMLKLISSCAHLHARQANVRESLLHLKIRAKENNTTGLKADVNDQWIHVCRLCSCVLRLAHHLFPAQSDFQFRETIAIRSLYSNALAHLRRFTEAHRKLDEAFAYLFNSRFAVHDAHWGILALRRAEVYLYEALEGFNVYNGIDSTLRRRLSKLDDSWAGIERAERWLGGTNQSNWWWGRLHTIKLRILAAVRELDDIARKGDKPCSKGKFFSLTQRSRIDSIRQVQDIFDQVRLMVPSDELRTARVLDSVSLIGSFSNKGDTNSDAWKRLLDNCVELFDRLEPETVAKDEELRLYFRLLHIEVYRRAGRSEEDIEKMLSLQVETEPDTPEPVVPKDNGPGLSPQPEPTQDPNAGHSVATVTLPDPAEANAPKVFISYVREDKEYADKMAKHLNNAGIDPWVDADKLRSGHRWIHKIEDAISKEADYFVVLLSRALSNRDESYVHKEVNLALQRAELRPGRRFIFPLKIEEGAEHIEALERAGIQTGSLCDWDIDVGRLAQDILHEYKQWKKC